MAVQTTFVSRSVTESKTTKNLFGRGLTSTEKIHYQCPAEELIAETLNEREGELSSSGALVIRTGKFTGRSPKDKYIVRDMITGCSVNWGDTNVPLSQQQFDIMYAKAMSYLNNLDRLWVRDCHACADPAFRLSIRVINEKPWGNLFAMNMFLEPAPGDLEDFTPEWNVINLPGLELDAAACGIRQSNAVVISFTQRLILIVGTGYTGEIKKSVFSVLNFLLPAYHDTLSMHCSANMGKDGSTAIFFGLSGTGKTTLSADPDRLLIGDDEHAWSDDRVFNLEGGCYAKCINLCEEKEPEIFHAIRPGALLENVSFFKGSNTIDYSSAAITENTRVSYPLSFIPNAVRPSIGPAPRNIFFLTCDAFGVLPPIAKLSPAQAMYHFISGYTAKVAGTETGVTEPKPTFSACFGAPFMPLHPGTYARMLGERMERFHSNVWLINTGWTGGKTGVGERIPLSYTRAMINAILAGELDHVMTHPDAVFGFGVPECCPGVPSQLLDPRSTWADRDAYDQAASALATLFRNNFEKYREGVTSGILNAGPACA
jgi:phosphoenolpyruvate carboxykinase (ATP)